MTHLRPINYLPRSSWDQAGILRQQARERALLQAYDRARARYRWRRRAIAWGVLILSFGWPVAAYLWIA